MTRVNPFSFVEYYDRKASQSSGAERLIALTLAEAIRQHEALSFEGVHFGSKEFLSLRREQTRLSHLIIFLLDSPR